MEKCIFCSKEKKEGINLLEAFICSPCERELINAPVAGDRYKYYLAKLKQVWQSNLSC